MRPFSHALADLRLAARRFAKTPGWTTLAAGTLAIGLAASTVTLVLVRDVLLAPLPFPEPDRLVRLLEVSENGRRWWPSFPNAADWRAHARMFDGIGIADIPRVLPVLLDGTAVRVPVTRAARGFFDTVGVRPVAGRLFGPDENRSGGVAVAVVSERFWRTQLGARNPGADTVTIGAERYTVVGVLPAGFRFLGDGAAWTEPADVWTPMDRDAGLGGRTSHGYHVVARLKRGVTLDRARADMNQLARTLKSEHRQPTQADSVLLTPLQDLVVRNAREPLRLLLYAAGAVLLVACLNLAASILAQGLGRARELSVRLALGATRWTLARLLLIEAQALALPAAAAGLLVAALGLQVIRSAGAGSLPRLDEARLDPQAVVLAMLLALATATVAGLLPAVLLSRHGLVDRLRTHGATTGPPEHRRVWTTFVVAQAALTVMLLAGTGLLVRSFVRALQVDLGYDATNVLAVDVFLPDGRFTDPARRLAYYDAALDRLRASEGVTAAGLTNALPHVTSMLTSGTHRDVADAKTILAGYRLVDPGFFDAMGIVRIQGDARALASGGAVIDTRLADVLWEGNSAVGDRLVNGFANEVLTVSGIVRNVREWSQEDDTIGAVYQDYRRRPDRIREMHFVVRYRGDAAAAAQTVRRALAAIDPQVPVGIEPLASLAQASLGDRRLFVVLAGGFGAIALLLSAAGVHAMVAFLVTRRRREAAIRLALGAQPSDVLGRVLIQGLIPSAIGTATGLALAVPLGRAMEAQLFHVRPTDPAVFVTTAIAVACAALLASIVPARRAARVDPVVALRQD